jgi:hypothetical protein
VRSQAHDLTKIQRELKFHLEFALEIMNGASPEWMSLALHWVQELQHIGLQAHPSDNLSRMQGVQLCLQGNMVLCIVGVFLEGHHMAEMGEALLMKSQLPVWHHARAETWIVSKGTPESGRVSWRGGELNWFASKTQTTPLAALESSGTGMGEALLPMKKAVLLLMLLPKTNMVLLMDRRQRVELLAGSK